MAMLGQMAVLLGIAYFFVTQVIGWVSCSSSYSKYRFSQS